MLDIAVDHVVFRLHHRQRMQVAFRDDALRTFDARGAPFLAHAVIQDLALVHQVAQRLQRLLQRRRRVETMAVVQVDVVGVEVLQGTVAVVEDVLAAQSAAVHGIAGREEHLGRDDHVLTRNLLDESAEEHFGVTAGIRVGAVEEVHTHIERLFGDVHGVVDGGGVFQTRHPTAQRDFRNLDSRLAHIAIMHGLLPCSLLLHFHDYGTGTYGTALC